MYDDSWDKPHDPTTDLLWQESDWYVFFDEKSGIGGAHRVGQKPNQGTGQLTLFCFGPHGQRYVRNDGHSNDCPLEPGYRTEAGQIVASHRVDAMGNGMMRYKWIEDGCCGDLEFYDPFYVPRGWGKGAKSADYNKLQSRIQSGGKLQSSGRLRGTIRLGDESYQIDALCHRDRAWGRRDSAGVSMHRYRLFSGTVGRRLSFASFSMDLKDGARVCGGFIVRDGVEQEISDVRIIATLDYDGLSPLSGVALFTLDDGEILKLSCDGVQGFMTPVPESYAVSSDTISTLEYGGERGFCTLEMCNNPGRGSYVPMQQDLSLLAIAPGLSPTASYRI